MASSFWTEDKIEFLRGIYQGKTNRELAEICSQEFGRSFTPAALQTVLFRNFGNRKAKVCCFAFLPVRIARL